MKELEVDGQIAVPVLRPEEALDVDAGSLCINCLLIISEGFDYCSTECRAADIWQWNL
ncbi:hypothetical protein ACP4OV_020988 [Aristida adscensionis]